MRLLLRFIKHWGHINLPILQITVLIFFLFLPQSFVHAADGSQSLKCHCWKLTQTSPEASPATEDIGCRLPEACEEPRDQSLGDRATIETFINKQITYKCIADAACNPEVKHDVIDTPGSTISIPLPLGKVSLPQLFGRVIKSLLGFAGIVALLMFIYGGFMYMTAAGESEKIEKGKNTVIWATIGLIALFSSYFIADFIIKLVQK